MRKLRVAPPKKTIPIVEKAPVAPAIIKRAILIGINYIGTSAELRGCINDVNNIYVWLTKECGYSPSNIQVYTDQPNGDPAFRPTRANIEKAVRWLHAGVVPNTPVQLFVHYSGHGSWTVDRNGDEADRRDETICPVDYATAGCITDDALYKLIVAPIAPRPNVQLTCLFDCCHSGTALDLRYDFEIQFASTNAALRTYKMVQQKTLAKTECQVLLWSGCLDTQTAADAFIANTSQGAMTWGFLSVVRKNKNNVSFKKLLSELQVQLRSMRFDQVAHLSCSKIVSLSDRVLF